MASSKLSVLGLSEGFPDALRLSVVDVVSIYAVFGVCHTTGKLLWAWLKARRMHRMLEDVPRARYSAPDGFFGFFADMKANLRRLHDWNNEITKGLRIAKLIGMPFEPSQVGVVVKDPACIRHFLKDSFNKYTKANGKTNPIFYYMVQWLGFGIFTFQHGSGAEDGGAEWQMQRKIAAGIFNRANFQNNMGEVFNEKAARMCSLLEPAAREGKATDLQRYFFAFTMDSIAQIFFGEHADTLDNGVCDYGDAYDACHRHLFDYIRPNIAKLLMSSYLPWPLGVMGGLAWQLIQWTDPHYREFRKALRILDRESERMIAQCRSDPNMAARKDLLALFLQAEEKQRFSKKYLRDMVVNFVIAGRDTTACTLSWLFYVLCNNQDVQKKLLEEIDSKLPRGTLPTLKALQASNMPYLNGVLYEVLRLHPPVPQDSKFAFEDDVFPDGTKIPKGTQCFWHPYSLGRDEKTYPEPSAVRPERWIPFAAPPPHEFPVFQAGPRICLGMDMAIFEAKLVTVTLLQRFTFSMEQRELDKIHYSHTLTMSVCNSKQQDSHNLWIIPKLRS